MSSDRQEHVVKITKNLGEEYRDDVMAFINKKLAEYKGTQDGGATVTSHGVPVMVFKTSKDAHLFATALSESTNYPREHIEIKPRGPAPERDRQSGKT
jgi:hypothetical protein